MRVQDLRDSVRARQRYFYHKRGWSKYEAKFPWRWEAYFHKRIEGDWFHCTMTLGGEDTRAVSVHLNFLWFGIFLTAVQLLPRRWEIGWFMRNGVKNPRRFEDSGGRGFGAYLHNNHLVFMWNHPRDGGRNSGGFYWSCFIDEKIFGRRQYAQVNPVEKKNVEIWFPEGVYHLNIVLSEDTWTYKRWPHWPLKAVVPRAHIDVVEKTGIPKPGKGENSWDCGDDATHGLTCQAASLHQAIEAMRECVNNTRRRHGSGEAMYVNRAVSQ